MWPFLPIESQSFCSYFYDLFIYCEKARIWFTLILKLKKKSTIVILFTSEKQDNLRLVHNVSRQLYYRSEMGGKCCIISIMDDFWENPVPQCIRRGVQTHDDKRAPFMKFIIV